MLRDKLRVFVSRLSPPLETGANVPSHTLAAASNKDSGHGLLAQMDSFRYNEHEKSHLVEDMNRLSDF